MILLGARTRYIKLSRQSTDCQHSSVFSITEHQCWIYLTDISLKFCPYFFSLILSKCSYRKIPIISPRLIFVQKAFLLGLFSGELTCPVIFVFIQSGSLERDIRYYVFLFWIDSKINQVTLSNG